MRHRNIGGKASAVLLALLLSCGLAAGEGRANCEGVEGIKALLIEAKQKSLASQLAEIRSAHCAVIRKLVETTFQNKVRAGRKLEPDRPFDSGEAEKQLSSARSNPEIRSAIDAELTGVAEPRVRLLLEAAVLRDEDQLLASRLLMQRLASMPEN